MTKTEEDEFLHLKFNFSTFNITGLSDNSSLTTKPSEVSRPWEKPLSKNERFLIAAFVTIMLFGVIGNSLVCYVFGMKRKRRSRSTTEWLILYLGIVDLFASLCNPPLFIYWTYTRHSQWAFGQIGCKILPALGPITTSASAGILLIFAIDRFMAIVAPFIGQLSWRTITGACILNVILCILSNVHYMYNLNLYYGRYCFVINIKSPEYGIPNCFFIFLRLITFTVIFSYTNIRIFVVLMRNNGRYYSNDQYRVQRNKQSTRIMVVLLTMGIVFVLLVFPREMFYLVYNLSWINSDNGLKYSPKLLLINSWLKAFHTANSCANVFIYSQMQTYFRKHLLRSLYMIGCCKSRISDILNTITYDSRYNRSRRPTLETKTCPYQQNYEQREQLIPTAPPLETFFKRAYAWRTRKASDMAVLV